MQALSRWRTAARARTVARAAAQHVARRSVGRRLRALISRWLSAANARTAVRCAVCNAHRAGCTVHNAPLRRQRATRSLRAFHIRNALVRCLRMWREVAARQGDDARAQAAASESLRRLRLHAALRQWRERMDAKYAAQCFAFSMLPVLNPKACCTLQACVPLAQRGGTAPAAALHVAAQHAPLEACSSTGTQIIHRTLSHAMYSAAGDVGSRAVARSASGARAVSRSPITAGVITNKKRPQRWGLGCPASRSAH